MTISIADAVKSQPQISKEPGYTKWIEEDDADALNEALEKWGFSSINEDGEIEIEAED